MSTRQHVCDDAEHCLMCANTERLDREAAAQEAQTLFQQQSRPLHNETPEQRHMRLADTRERYSTAHRIWWKIKEKFKGRVPTDVNWHDVTAPYAKGQEVAQSFEALPSNPNDPAVRRAYRRLVAVAEEQYVFLTEELHIEVEYVNDPEPYLSATEQFIDVTTNGHLSIATINIWPDSYHPLLTNDRGGEYDMFRAVHDAIGHVATGTGFDRHGEYISWVFHALLCGDDEACAAISTELHGENSYLWNRGVPAPHKAALLPAHLRDPHVDLARIRTNQ